MQKSTFITTLSAAALIATSIAASVQAARIVEEASAAPPPQALRTVQLRECSQRVGPFVTQSTAWQRLNEAKSFGYATSGVFPCYDAGTRGYCFNVFYAC